MKKSSIYIRTIALLFFLSSNNLYSQILEFKYLGDFKTDVEDLNYSVMKPYSSTTNTEFIYRNVTDASYIIYKNGKSEVVKFENGRGEYELQVFDFYIYIKENLFIYDPSLAKLLIRDSNKKNHEFEIEGNYNQIIYNQNLSNEQQIAFTLIEVTSGSSANFIYNNSSEDISKIDIREYSDSFQLELEDNVFNLINMVHFYSNDKFVLVNMYYPFYYMYDIKTDGLVRKEIYDLDSFKSKPKKEGDMIMSPDDVIKTSIVKDNYLYVVYNKNEKGLKSNEYIIRLNLETGKKKEIKFINEIETFIENISGKIAFITKENKIFEITKSVE